MKAGTLWDFLLEFRAWAAQSVLRQPGRLYDLGRPGKVTIPRRL